MIVSNLGSGWFVEHKAHGRFGPFESEDAAYAWADRHIDDQMFDNPNEFSPPPERFRVLPTPTKEPTDG